MEFQKSVNNKPDIANEDNLQIGTVDITGNPLILHTKGGNIILDYGNGGIYRTPAVFENSVLFVGDGDGRYALKAHKHNGINGTFDVAKQGGGGYKLTFIDGILTDSAVNS